MELSTKNNKGFTLVEAVISMTILLLMGIGGVAANRLATAGVALNQNRSQANFLAEEAMEALMNVRAYDFLAISAGTFHPIFDGTKYNLVPGNETIGPFTRSITITPVLRELSCFSVVCDITDEGGITDEGSFRTSIRVIWNQQGEEKLIELSSLITYWR